MGIFDFFKKNRTNNEMRENINVSVKVETNIIGRNEEIVPLEYYIKNAIQSKQGLYPHEILMLEYSTKFKTSNNDFQKFWYYDYSITDPQKILDSLDRRGFIEKGDLKSALDKIKLSEIKEELKSIDQKVTGKKEELIDRLLEYGDINSLNKKYSERYYVLTSLGEQELKENEYVSYLHRNKYMTIWEMNKRITQTHYSYRDILWGYFNDQSIQHFGNYDFGLYRNTRLNMVNFLMEENKINDAFCRLCEVAAVDLSGLGNSEKYLFEQEKEGTEFFLNFYKEHLEYFLANDELSVIIAPGIVRYFIDMKDKLEMNDIEYRESILNELNKICLPRNIFTVDERVDVLMAYLSNDKAVLGEICKKAKKREMARLQAIKEKYKRKGR